MAGAGGFPVFVISPALKFCPGGWFVDFLVLNCFESMAGAGDFHIFVISPALNFCPGG